MDEATQAMWVRATYGTATSGTFTNVIRTPIVLNLDTSRAVAYLSDYSRSLKPRSPLRPRRFPKQPICALPASTQGDPKPDER